MAAIAACATQGFHQFTVDNASPMTVNWTASAAGVPISVTKGCYISLTGTNPRAMVNIYRAVGYYSDGAIRDAAYR